MKLAVDAALCQAYGLCEDEAPDLVELDDFGYSGIRGDGEVPADREEAARAAIEICPVKALRLL